MKEWYHFQANTLWINSRGPLLYAHQKTAYCGIIELSNYSPPDIRSLYNVYWGDVLVQGEYFPKATIRGVITRAATPEEVEKFKHEYIYKTLEQ